jgi:hypothetical protein
MLAKSIKGTSPEDINSALRDAMADGFRPTLAIVFLSVKQDRAAVCKMFKDSGIAVFGCTTHGEFIDEELGKESITILLLDMKEEFFWIYLRDFPTGNYRAATSEIAQLAREEFARPAFLISGAHMSTDAEELLKGFEDVIGTEVNVYGSMAGDDMSFTEQFVFTNDRESNRGVVVLALDEDKIKIRGRATCGWKAVGTPKTVTRSEGNHVFTVDDVPVLDLTVKYSGFDSISRDAAAKDTALLIATTLPLQLQREKGDPIMRPGLIVNFDDGSFICSGTVPQGSKVRFSVPPDFDVMDTVIQQAGDLKEKEMPEADALVVFSCAGRLLAFGPMMNMEIEGIRKLWNVPMAGMFSNGELARATNGNLEMHNLTTCCVALKAYK